MTKECLWYNGAMGIYELLDFNPDGLEKENIIEKAWKLVKMYGFSEDEKAKVLKTLYLIDIEALKRVV